MENNENQGELFEFDFDDSKEEASKWTAVLYKERAVKLATDNALRKGTLVYTKDVEAGFRRMLNVVYGTLQVLLSETLPGELIAIQTTGEMRDRLVSAYNEILEKGRVALETELKTKQESENDIKEDNGEPAA